MKRRSKILSLMLVSMFSFAAVGVGSIAYNEAKADEITAVSVLPSDIFKTKSSASTTETVAADKTDATKTALTLKNNGKISYKRDLALKWYDGKDSVKYFTMNFKLADKNFEKLTFTFESAVANSAKDDKAVNTIVFAKDESDNVTVAVNDETATSIDVTGELVLKLTDEAETEIGNFAVEINSTKVGTFTNIGANYFDWNSSLTTPITITASIPADADEAHNSTVIILNSLNEQSFALNDAGKLTDNAKPTLIVNEDLTGFTLGTAFSLDYEIMDVVDNSLSKTDIIKYYQYNPNDTEVSYTNKLTTSTYFMDTTFTKGDKETSVYKEDDMEYISVQITVSDDTYKGENAMVYDLTWFVDAAHRVSPKNGTTATIENNAVSSLDYIKLDINTVGPEYKWVDADVTAYQSRVDEVAKDTVAASGEYFNLPSIIGMFIDDDTMYTSMRFSIYYKSPSSTSGTSSTNLKSTSLRIPVSQAGYYEFKILAVDKTANESTYIPAGETEPVKITADNIWDLEDIPSYNFMVEGKSLEVKDEDSSDRQEKGLINVKKTVSSFDVKGLSSYNSTYALYYFDMDLLKSKFPTANVNADVLAEVSYSNLAANVNPTNVEDYAEYVAELYAEKLANIISGVEKADLWEKDANGNAVLRRIEDYNEEYDKDVYPDNVYEWKSSSLSFMPVNYGSYIVFGAFTDSELFGTMQGGYKVVSITAKEDIIKGESEWLKNNLVSVILFVIAGVLGIAVIVLLFIKPSDENLEDVDKKGKSKKEKKSKKDKNAETIEEDKKEDETNS